MVAEEIGLNEFLEENGVEPVETDLGEYIIQIRHEAPSHIIAPAVHLTKEQIEADFRAAHTGLPADRDLSEPTTLLNEARGILRQRYFEADVGITGANFLIAETGTSVIVTNEGNGDLTQTLPRVHIVLASIEKVVPTLDDASQILRLLARSATGQEMSAYTTFSTGPRRPQDPDGPAAYHVVILDNGRSAMLGSEFEEMLRCIRCGACMNHCPVYQEIGGHAYGWVYPGPMGAVLTPALIGIDKAGRPSQRLDVLRALRKRVPDENTAAEDDAALAGEGIRAPPATGDVPLRPAPLGVLRAGGRSSTSSRRASRCARSATSPDGAAASAACRLPADGRNIATCRRLRGARSRTCGRSGRRERRRRERARPRVRQGSPRARRDRRGTTAKRNRGRPPDAAAARRDPAARATSAGRAHRAFCAHGREDVRDNRARRRRGGAAAGGVGLPARQQPSGEPQDRRRPIHHPTRLEEDDDRTAPRRHPTATTRWGSPTHSRRWRKAGRWC